MRSTLLVSVLVALHLGACARPAAPPLASPPAPSAGPVTLETLKPGVVAQGFVAEIRWVDDAGRPIGARFRHQATGFELDVLRIESSPQAFIWVKSFAVSDMGEAHTQEHLLLGKGSKGKWVSNLEQMEIAASSAYTTKWRTCYHMTALVPASFWKVLDGDLDGLLHPDYSDEEIAREVSNFGVSDAPDGSLRLEEKGTVYQEMARSYEEPVYLLYRAFEQLVYGPAHPLALSEGGWPDAIRRMTPDDIRRFHHDHYHLGNMGMIVSLPSSIALGETLAQTDAILVRQGRGQTGHSYTEAELPAPSPAASGRVEIVEFPAAGATTPSPVFYAWPADRQLSPRDRTGLGLFLDALAGDESTELYRLLIDSKTRVLDTGATGIGATVEENLGSPPVIMLSGVPARTITPEGLAAIRDQITGAIQRVAEAPDGSPELLAFNARVLSRITDTRRRLNKAATSPPQFGSRNADWFWMRHLHWLGETSGFDRSVTLRPELDAIEALLKAPKNPWRDELTAWKVLGVVPYVIAGRPTPALVEKEAAARDARVAAELARLQKQYGAADAAATLRKFKVDYDKKSAEIEEMERKVPLPELTRTPPMTLDDGLQVSERKVAGIPLVASTFGSMPSTTVGLAFRLDGVAEADLPYLAVLPDLLVDSGIAGGGETISYQDVRERVRKEVLGLSVASTVSSRSGRAELLVVGSGNDAAETQAALVWMRRVLLAPDWRPENLGRLRDVLSREASSLRTLLLGREEDWADGAPSPLDTLWKQRSPLHLHAASFLTRAHDAQRIRWRLEDAGADLPAVVGYLRRLEAAGGLSRTRLLAVLASLQHPGKLDRDKQPRPYVTALAPLTPAARALVAKAAADLADSLAEVPDASLRADFTALCREIAADLAVPPADALAALARVRATVVRASGARAWSASGTDGVEPLAAGLAELAGQLDAGPFTAQTYGDRPLIDARISARLGRPTVPRLYGLVNAGTSVGLYMASAPGASYATSDDEGILRYLAGNLYGGHGAHSTFMKTWAAGLAYSNGLRPSISQGRYAYYAERSPRLPQTLRFVADLLRAATPDEKLVDYAVVQAFGSRLDGTFEDRARNHANDLADGLRPEVVRAFRERLLALKGRSGLARALFDRLEAVTGQVLPGFGPSDVPGLVALAVGPEEQLAQLDAYVREVDGKDATVTRIWPRDFWIDWVEPASAKDR